MGARGLTCGAFDNQREDRCDNGSKNEFRYPSDVPLDFASEGLAAIVSGLQFGECQFTIGQRLGNGLVHITILVGALLQTFQPESEGVVLPGLIVSAHGPGASFAASSVVSDGAGIFSVFDFLGIERVSARAIT